MVKRKQVIENNENLINFTTRISSRIKKKLVDYSEKHGQSQAMVISELIDHHLPNQDKPGISLAPPPYQEDDTSVERLASRDEMVKWIRSHED